MTEINNDGLWELILDNDELEPVFVAVVSNTYQDHNVTGVEITYESCFGSGKIHGSARRNPMDRHDSDMALEIAVSRAIASLAHRFQKRANGLVKHQDDMVTMRKALKEMAKGHPGAARPAKKVGKKAKA